MNPTSSSTNFSAFSVNGRDGPLPALLLVLTFTTGVIDAVTVLGLGHVFVANMTGNLLFLGYTVGGSDRYPLHTLLSALIGFLLGTIAGGRLCGSTVVHRGRLLTLALRLELLVIAVALGLAIVTAASRPPAAEAALVGLLALAMGVQNAIAPRLAVADLSTTALTLTLTGLFADASAQREEAWREKRRLAAIVAMVVGATLGAVLLFRFGVVAPLAVALGLMVANAAAAHRVSRSTAAWTRA
jgi:uncharacterized membrane protein YoaK (UPF0700 family)